MKHVFFYSMCIVLCCTSICFSNNVNIEVSITGPSTGYIGQNLTYNATVNVSAQSSDVEWFIDGSKVGEGFTYSFTPKTQTESGGHSIKAKVFGSHDSTPIYYTVSLPNAYMWCSDSEILVRDTVNLQCRPSEQNVSFEEIAPPFIW